MSARILIVEDDRTFRGLLQTILSGEGYAPQVAETAEEGLTLLGRNQFDLVLSDLKLPGMSGLELFRASRKDGAAPPFILLTAFGTIEEAVAAMKEGVADFLTKPLKDPEMLRALVRKILQAGSRERDYLALKETEAAGLPPDELIFAGQAMGEVRRLVGEVAATATTVLLQGESGTGKELVARAIHLYSPRKQGAFVAVNCAAIPENLLESELFGHERGAFTGALAARRGKFELAQGGTLFLDEIGELPQTLQAKLLRVLQERRFERVGGSREMIAEVRVIAATNRDLVVEVQEKRFREDLFYRLNVFPIHLPPLRQRIDILPELVGYFIRRFARLTGKAVTGMEDGAMALLCHYGWPGNIRELQNVIERAVILGHGRLGVRQLPEALVVARGDDACPSPLLEDVERQAILDALDACGHNRRLAAEKLGISKRTLQYRLKRYGLVGKE
ncbi:MAG: sigma-54-dependent Fis family transcriptional regulator [Desulfuromonadaceae bacterium GWC2_58_13]|nr:MAG: sigma-54-dependent Fis family transcriptional regulator [Desulfuromonadaceae bacterium GWC2_58_13]